MPVKAYASPFFSFQKIPAADRGTVFRQMPANGGNIYRKMPASSSTMPERIPTTVSTANIFKFSPLCRFTLNRTTRPTPAPVHSPAITDANDMAPFRYSCVSMTDAAQFGIRPMTAAMTG